MQAPSDCPMRRAPAFGGLSLTYGTIATDLAFVDGRGTRYGIVLHKAWQLPHVTGATWSDHPELTTRMRLFRETSIDGRKSDEVHEATNAAVIAASSVSSRRP